MALYSDDIIAKVRLILDDPYPGIAATNEELNGWINTAQRTIAAAIPGTTAKHDDAFPLKAGSQQQLPSGASRLLSMYGNRPNPARGAVIVGGGAARDDSAVKSVPIRKAMKKDIETNIPGWRGSKRMPNCAFQYYLYDVDDPLDFYLYPAALGPPDDSNRVFGETGFDPMQAAGNAAAESELIEIVYSQAPNEVEWRETGEEGVFNMVEGSAVTLEQTQLMIPDIYEDPIINFVLHQAYSKPPHTNQRQAFAQRRIALFYNVVPAARELDVEATPEADRDPERGA